MIDSQPHISWGESQDRPITVRHDEGGAHSDLYYATLLSRYEHLELNRQTTAATQKAAREGVKIANFFGEEV